ncbi:hypothetical protein GJ688_18800 [Heliobacillus mobilis]|uniref:Uncharacterized protein n=1 Tax=Heliobacterium mobile TaxID=28064 RepID=A0A6I3SPZ5_HELMO|nr:hypothetical protein [Heliobacterium mobile]MTV50969.1 hypothetical protein [Heliobacterium mobile]
MKLEVSVWDFIGLKLDVYKVLTDYKKVTMETWSASLTDDDNYDTVFAVKTINPTVKKVVVSNDGDYLNRLTLEEVKNKSTIYVEMDIDNGYALHYCQLKSDIGSFVFRGLNEKREIVQATY